MQSAFLMSDGVYPIPMIYLKCVEAICQINQKAQEEAKNQFLLRGKWQEKMDF